MNGFELSPEQLIQDKEYNFPYHYIPVYSDGKFSQTRYWSWGFRYLGGIKIVFDQLEEDSFKSLLDVGCGDGRFLKEVSMRYSDIECMGIDRSSCAIQLAKAMNPRVTYKCLDITREKNLKKYDVITAIEVLEHIFPNQLDEFIGGIASVLNSNGRLILTVPHKNKPIQDKHYQHFSGEDLVKILRPYFKEIELVPFDPISKFMLFVKKLIGGSGDRFIITHSRILSGIYNIYINKYLYASGEEKCMRICAVCRKK